MSELIEELRIIDEGGNSLFDFEAQYIVPLYQRAYAWEEKEIVQLIHDIYYMEQEESATYYLGSLIVSRNGNEYEVIDGQQRLTTLFIVLKCLYEKGALTQAVSNTLRFACRDKSNYTLQNLFRLIEGDRIEESIRAGRDIVLCELNKVDFSVNRFTEFLKKVILYRIEMPQNTDLNRYFEIMNTRGEQLEQHDILKASLMGFLKDSTEKAWFADIWDACRDMTGYVQMHFDVKARELLFGGRWDRLPTFGCLTDLGDNGKSSGGHIVRINQIIRDDFQVERFDGIEDNSDRVRFESIIEFPYFLLHVLKVFAETKKIVSRDGRLLIDEQLDDRKLKRAFDRVVTDGMMDGNCILEQREEFAREFVKHLLRCRYLFDKYILKREYVNEDAEGKWSIKELQQSKKKAYFRNSDFGRSGEWENTRERRTRNNIMLQSCLRVSYTSPKVMHWITELLIWLNKDNCANLEQLTEFETISENIARRAVKKDYLDVCQAANPACYNKGVNTPHIVFNYLDYLLWKETGEEFTFEFRNSVEHWYPQHPSEGTFEQWSHDEGVDNFGNLCIIQRSVNSKFSNMSPDAKKSTFEDMIKKGSLKLRRMAELTTGQAGKSASAIWREGLYLYHEQDMIEKLTAACYS